MPDIMVNTAKVRRVPPGRGKTAISGGQVLDTLIQILESQEGFRAETCAAFRLDLSWGWYVPRAFLTLEQAVIALEQADVTMQELFTHAGCNVFFEHDDAMMRILIHRLDEEALERILTLIRECQDPWWLPLMDGAQIPAAERLRIIVRHRPECYDGHKLRSQQYPVLHSYTPFSKTYFIRTDDLPELADELDVHMSALTNLDCTLLWFSDWPMAERVWAEYSMLDRPLRSKVLQQVEQISEEYRRAGKLHSRCMGT